MPPSLLLAVAVVATACAGVAEVAQAQSALSGETIRMGHAAQHHHRRSATGSRTTAGSCRRGNTRRTATFFVATLHKIHYDAITDDASREHSSLYFWWESAARIGRASLGARDSDPVQLAAVPPGRSV